MHKNTTLLPDSYRHKNSAQQLNYAHKYKGKEEAYTQDGSYHILAGISSIIQQRSAPEEAIRLFAEIQLQRCKRPFVNYTIIWLIILLEEGVHHNRYIATVGSQTLTALQQVAMSS